MRIILASKSPRRVEILKQIGTEFEIMPADTDESVTPGTSPEDAVCEISRRKALCIRDLIGSSENVFIISADTVVTYDGKIIGKPENDKHAYDILKNLSGKSHRVLTGFTLCMGNIIHTDYESTDVFFRHLTDEEIEEYVKSGEPADKAGAYGIQDKGSVFVTGISGDYYNVMGFPICKITSLAKELFGVKLENFKNK